MLSTEHEIQIGDFTLYRDLQTEDKYYYLPSEKARIADNGKKIHFVAYKDGEIREGEAPSFDTDYKQAGGFLTLEVELGPDANELATIKQKLESQVGKSVTLAPVPFKDGKVELILLSSKGNDSTVKVTIAGSTKPSLIGRQTAVFSARLGGLEAQIMWDLLNNSPQTQAAVLYELSFLGVIPAYYVKIKVDYSATEEYKRHHFDANLDFSLVNSKATNEVKENEKEKEKESDKLDMDFSVIGSVDVDTMMRELISNGAIEITTIDYAGKETGSPLPANDPTALELVKKLISNEIFQPTPLQPSDYGDLTGNKPEESSNAPAGGETGADTPGDQQGGQDPEADKKKGQEGQKGKDAPGPKTEQAPDQKAGPDSKNENKNGKTSQFKSPNPSITAPAKDNTTQDTTQKDTQKKETGEPATLFTANKDAANNTETETKDKPLIHPETTAPKPEGDDNGTNNPPTPPTGNRGGGGGGTTTGDNDEPAPSKVGSMNIKASLNMGYTFRKRSTSEQVVRTYVFDKREAQTFKYYPSGMLSTKNTEFDPSTQTEFVRLGDGPFKDIQITFSSGIDFERYHISEMRISMTHNPLTSGGTIGKTISLTKENPSQPVYFLSQPFGMGVAGIDYKVSFIFDKNATVVGFGNSVPSVFTKSYQNIFERSIEIGVEDLEEVVPLEVSLGDVELEESGIKEVSVYLYSDIEGETPVLLREVKLMSSNSSEMLLINSQIHCRREIVYRFIKDEFEKIPASSRELRIVGEKSETGDIIVHSPTKGIIKVHPILEEATFESDIVGIAVTFKQGTTVIPITLTKATTKKYLVANYDQNSPADISVESIVVMRKDPDTRAITQESIEPLQKTITVDYTEVILPVF